MPFAAIPDSHAYRLRNCTVAPVFGGAIGSREGAVDIDIRDGRIAAIGPAAPPDPDLPSVDCRAGMAWPAFVDLHAHIDKAHISNRAPNPDGSWLAALETVRADRLARWTAADVERRMDFSLRSAFAHGTRALRTHIDSLPPQAAISWPVFARMRERWRGRIELQGSALGPVEMLLGEDGAALADLVADHQGILGCVLKSTPGPQAALDRVFGLARERGLELDFHVDETDDPGSTMLRHVAEAALRWSYEGRVTCGHCCSLAVQGEAEAEATMRLAARAGLTIASLPMCNLYLQDRSPGRTPRWRGVTLVRELAAAGVKVAFGSDNVRDPFYAYGDYDMLEVFREAVRIAHLDHPLGGWAASVTRIPAAQMRLAGAAAIEPGASADLVLFSARDWGELLSRPQADRIVIRSGRPIDTTPPDYAELDDLARRG
ncbi:MAG TPA: cytosine deaminase [Beijerinckiaceae bacterium]|nr:cytosine deaminase [Beijerinckiaceae bacterium]